MKILKTRNYENFSFYESNREAGHFVKIMKSIEERDLTPYNPIIVDQDLNIIDGQNRFLACKNLGIPVYYVIVPDGSDNDIKSLNTTQKNWSIQDYVYYWAKKGKEQYIRLLYDFNNQKSGLMTLQNATYFDATRPQADTVRSGTLHYDQANSDLFKKIDKITDAIMINSKSGHRKNALTRGIAVFLKRTGITPDSIIKCIERNHFLIKKYPDQAYYVDMLVDIWNYNRRKGNRI